jgi:hypothetical protein
MLEKIVENAAQINSKENALDSRRGRIDKKERSEVTQI